MKLVFLSNLLTPHQELICDKFYEMLGQDFIFIETISRNVELPKGWKPSAKQHDYLINHGGNNEAYILKIVNDAGVVIYGSAPEKFIYTRIKNGKLTFKYSERIYKKKFNWWEQPLRSLKNYFRGWSKKNHYLLCASAYAYADYQKTFNFTNRAYKWGYFPALNEYENIDELISKKERASILWVARLIEWKHPDASILVAERLKKEGYHFTLNLIGNGELRDKLAQMIEEKGIEDCVHMLGEMDPEEVRAHMEKSQIFMFTSDFNEGWGAVLNESMNSGCAVVASHAIGSVPYLMEDKKNGLIYKNGDIDDLYNKVKYLLDNSQKCTEFGKNAYLTLTKEWNSNVAAERFLHVAKNLLKGQSIDGLYTQGPCSEVKKLKNNWKR